MIITVDAIPYTLNKQAALPNNSSHAPAATAQNSPAKLATPDPPPPPHAVKRPRGEAGKMPAKNNNRPAPQASPPHTRQSKKTRPHIPRRNARAPNHFQNPPKPQMQQRIPRTRQRKSQIINV